MRRVHRVEHAATDNHDPVHVLGILPLRHPPATTVTIVTSVAVKAQGPAANLGKDHE